MLIKAISIHDGEKKRPYVPDYKKQLINNTLRELINTE